MDTNKNRKYTQYYNLFLKKYTEFNNIIFIINPNIVQLLHKTHFFCPISSCFMGMVKQIRTPSV